LRPLGFDRGIVVCLAAIRGMPMASQLALGQALNVVPSAIGAGD